MSNTPFMPLWVADFVGDTLDLDAKEIGAYMLILMTMWGRDGALPNDQRKLQRVARCGRDWPKVWEAIGRYFTVEGDTITQGRLRKELQKVAAKREVNAQSGALGGKAKALKEKKVPLANATVSPKQPEPEPEPDKKKIDGGGSGEFGQSAREILPEAYTLRESILQTLGADPQSGILGPNGRVIGTPEDMAEVNRWLALPGITGDLVLDEIRRITKERGTKGARPSTIKYFRPIFQRLSGELSAPPLTPTAPQAAGANHRSAPRPRLNPDDYDPTTGKRIRAK